ncbi:hypothetical protein ACS127_01780 [Amphibacillus sp. Q70]|uniref:hypothetical protein n=1 Tax=Amphibacillus sp. Q70 TaxID=3453416 RepID=UPI003F878703
MKEYTLFVYPNKTMENIDDISLRKDHERYKILNFHDLSFVSFFSSSFTGEGNLKGVLKHQIIGIEV